jgi:hypothetical protein
MEKIDFTRLCGLFKEKVGMTFIERVERRIGQDFEIAIKENPEKLLGSILQDIHHYYVLPFEMTLEIAEYLNEKYQISEISFAFSPEFKLSLTNKIEDVKKFVEQFYLMANELGFAEKFKRSYVKWWMK